MTSLLSAKAMLFSSLCLLFYDLLDRREILAVRAQGRSQRFAGAMSAHLLAQPEMMTLGKKRSPLAMTPADYRPLEKRVFTKPARFDLGLPPVTLPRKRSHKSGRNKDFKILTAVSGLECEKTVRLRKPRSVQAAKKRGPPSVGTGYTFSRLPWKRRKPRHGQCEHSVFKTLPVGYETRQYPYEVIFWQILKDTAGCLWLSKRTFWSLADSL